MVSDSPRPARARSAAEKSQRRNDILRAAERLWTTTPYADLSMNQVAKEARLAKGTLYLYFDTKEELFLALLGEHLHGWADRVTGLLEQRPPRTAEEVANVLLQATDELAPLRRLLVLLGTVLERNVRPELVMEFQRDLKLRLRGLVQYMPYKPNTTMRILRHLYAAAIGWQQLSEEIPRQEDPDILPELQGTWTESFSTEFELTMRAVIDRLAREDGKA